MDDDLDLAVEHVQQREECIDGFPIVGLIDEAVELRSRGPQSAEISRLEKGLAARRRCTARVRLYSSNS